VTRMGNAFLTFAAAATFAAWPMSGEERTSNARTPKPAAVVDVLPKAPAPPEAQNLKRQMQRLIAARDAESGGFRAATPAEQAELRGNIAARSATLAPPADPTIQLPNGTMALPPDISRLEFLTAERHADGSFTFNCANPLHKHQPRTAGRKGRNANDR
jgi:hypothetical protein